MASTSATRELAPALPPALLPGHSLGGRARVLALRAAALLHRPTVERWLWLSLAAGALAFTYAVAAVAHELIVVLAAWLLPPLTGLGLLQDLIAVLPVNFVYASAMLRYAGQIEVSGVAVAGDLGVALTDRWPAVF